MTDKRAKKIKVIAVDLDGTLTDGKYFVDDNGKVTKVFHTHDSWMLNRLQLLGFFVVIISGSTDSCGFHKANALKVPIILGSKNKVEDMTNIILDPKGLKWENVFFIGDAENDFAAIELAGLSAAPWNHAPEIPEVDYISSLEGGNRAVYDIGRWFLNLRQIEVNETNAGLKASQTKM